jgi:ATP-dependent DNA ligase
MKSLPTLFSRTSTGAVQQWTVQIDGNKFRVESGQTDGKKVLSEWTVCEPKNVGRANATTANEQAIGEAQAKWDKKVKLGYTTDVTKIDSSTSFVEPMLAKNFEDRLDKIDWDEGVFVQNKYNGARCVATYDGERVRLTTRKGEEYISIPHIANDLEKFFADYPEAVLDGELFSYDYRQKLNELMSIVRKTKKITDADLKKSEEMVCFHIYDGYNFGPATDVCVKYSNRKKRIDELLPKYSKYYRAVETEMAHSLDEVRAIFNKYVDDGQEGVIVRVPHSPYEHKRSSYLLKWKPLEDDEATIVEITEGKGNWAGTGKIITLDWNGKIFDATFKGTMEQGAKFLKEKNKWIGREVKFQYNGLTGLQIPNYARVDIENCDPTK